MYHKYIGQTTTGPVSAANTTTSIASAPSPTPSLPGLSAVVPDAGFRQFMVASLDHLKYLLQLACVKRPSSSGGLVVSSKQSQQEQLKLVALILSIALHPVFSSTSIFTEKSSAEKANYCIDLAFDVAATLVDGISEESQRFCARILKDKFKDSRVKWLLGSVNSFGSDRAQEVSHGLQMVKEGRGVVGSWQPKVWDMMESTSGREGDTSLALGLFGARRL